MADYLVFLVEMVRVVVIAILSSSGIGMVVIRGVFSGFWDSLASSGLAVTSYSSREERRKKRRGISRHEEDGAFATKLLLTSLFVI